MDSLSLWFIHGLAHGIAALSVRMVCGPHHGFLLLFFLLQVSLFSNQLSVLFPKAISACVASVGPKDPLGLALSHASIGNIQSWHIQE